MISSPVDELAEFQDIAEKDESSKSSNLCSRCDRDMKIPRNKYNWFLSKGYSEKDSAAQALYNPEIILPKSCCIIDLHTRVDPNAKKREYLDIIEKGNREREARLKLEGRDNPKREIVEVYAMDKDNVTGGSFTIIGAPFHDPKVLNLGKHFKNTKSFEITDIAFLPKNIAETSFGWTEQPLCLWSGTMKICPVVEIDGKLQPGVMYVRSTYNKKVSVRSQQFKVAEKRTPMTNVIDRTLLQSEIIYFRTEVIDVNLGAAGVIQTNIDIISLMKQEKHNIIGLKSN